MWEAIKDANRAVEPEESAEVRIAVLLTVLVAVVALLTEGVAGPVSTLGALFGIPFGFYLSHRMRRADALGLKAVLALTLVAAVGAFMVRATAAVSEGFGAVQLALAELFLWVQIIHSLHVPARRDLMFSVASSGVMFAIASALSIRLTIAPFLIAWLLGLVASLVLAHRSALRRLPALATDPPPIGAGAAPTALRSFAALLVVATLVFVALPAARSSRALSFPSSLSANLPIPDAGSLNNPSLGEGGPTGGPASAGGFAGRDSFGYFGFAEELDTSLRGRPDETLIMRVRAPAPAFWRGQTFDTWDGRTWTQSANEPVSIGGSEPIGIPRTAGDDAAFGEEFIQTFYMEQTGPNIVLGAYRASEVYFPDRFLFQLPEGALRSGVQMEAGTVYTVISHRPVVTARDLAANDPLRVGIPPEVAAHYLQVPDSTPTRVLDLAAEVTADATTTYDKVKAVEAWMAANTTYTLDIPPLPDGADSVDHYLFETRQGFCEQIGTSLVVMLRSLGIPARLVVGFTPGERNPFTGLYEVRGSDAHSWAEVYFPGIGWQGFDPTAAVPLSGEFDPGLAGEGLGRYFGERLDRALGVAPAVGFVVFAVAVAGTLIVLGAQLYQRRRRRATASWSDLALEQIDHIGRAAGAARSPTATLREYVHQLVDAAGADERLWDVAAVISADRLGPFPVSEAERRAAQEILDEIEHSSTSRRKAPLLVR